jgi:hypothetical protein
LRYVGRNFGVARLWWIGKSEVGRVKKGDREIVGIKSIVSSLGVLAYILYASASLAGDPATTCQTSKLKTVVKYDACRLKAYATAVKAGTLPDFARCSLLRFSDAEERADGACPTTGDQADIGSFVDFCTESVALALDGGALPMDCLTCSEDLTTCDGSLSSCESDLSSATADLGTCDSSLISCSSNLTSCSTGLSTCQDSLASANGSLADCNTDLSTANAGLATCQSDLGAATSGTATAGDVLTGRTFTSSAGLAASGFMPDNAAASITPGTSAQAIAAGYHNGSGSVAGDPDLVAENIKDGVNLFGVVGSLAEDCDQTCGNGVLDPGEQCDVGNTGGESCATMGFSSGTLFCAPGCTFDTSYCHSSRFDATGLTIIDNLTGLEWEKKVESDFCLDPLCAHNVDYQDLSWSDSGTAPDGDVFYLLDKFNGELGDCYANHCDWRLPTVEELQSIIVASCGAPPCVVDSLFLPSGSGLHWSSTPYLDDPVGQWAVSFETGDNTAHSKTSSIGTLRAVRTRL